MSEDFDFDVDQRICEDDDETIAALGEVYATRPLRHAWRFDSGAAPLNKTVYAREPDSLRVILAMREADGWCVITKDGVCHPLPAVGSWAVIAGTDEWAQ